MVRCPYCGTEISTRDNYCPTCKTEITEQELETSKEIEEYREKRKQMLAIFAISMFLIMFVPFFRELLAIISFGIAIPASIFYTWEKRRAEGRLEEPSG